MNIREKFAQYRENGFSDEIKNKLTKVRFNKKSAQAGIVAGMLALLMTFGLVNTNVSDEVVAEQASVEAAGVAEVAEAEASEWSNRLMADVDEYLTIRQAADINSAVAGKLRKTDVADIVETLDGWYHITSGSVDGYVKAEYCKTGEEAKALSEQVCVTYATASTGGLRVRSAADENSAIVTVMNQGGKLPVAKDATPAEGWVPVALKSSTGYVKAEYVTVETAYGKAISAAEEAAYIAQAKKAAEAAAQKTAAARVQNAPVAVNVDDVTLLAALIQHEAGSGSYDGKLAVGAVVMNRVRSGSYPSSVYNVINQRGQFGGGVSSLNSIINRGVSSSCVQAAQEAINGADNTGGSLQFRSARSGHAGTVIGGNVFW